jgi:predicted DNA-binding ribbon-helix-helix protein
MAKYTAPALDPEPMPPEERDRFVKSITLSEQTYKEFEIVAKYKKTPMATFMRQILEAHQESPSFGALLKRAKEALSEEGNESSDV